MCCAPITICHKAGLDVEPVQQVLVRYHKIGIHLNDSCVAQDSMQGRLDIPHHRLVQDIRTRWKQIPNEEH